MQRMLHVTGGWCYALVAQGGELAPVVGNEVQVALEELLGCVSQVARVEDATSFDLTLHTPEEVLDAVETVGLALTPPQPEQSESANG